MLVSDEKRQRPSESSECQQTAPEVSGTSDSCSTNSKPVKNKLHGTKKSGRETGVPSQQRSGRFEYRKFKTLPTNHSARRLPTGKNYPKNGPKNELESNTNEEARTQENDMNDGAVVSPKTNENEQKATNQSARESERNAESEVAQRTLNSQKPQKRRICKYFAQHQSCYFGNRCRFLHEQSQKLLPSTQYRSVQNATGVPAAASQPHQKDAVESGESSAKSEIPIPSFTLVMPDCISQEDGTEAGNFKPGPAFQTQRIPFTPGRIQLKREQLGSPEQLKAFDAEVAYFKRRFQRAEVRKTPAEGGAQVSFEYKVTDPEWVFDVNAVQFAISMPAGYPIVSGLECHVADRGRLPDALVVHLEKALAAYLTERWASFDGNNCYELIGKALIRWLDRSIFRLFVEGLKKTKMLFDAENAGISLVIPEAEPSEPSQLAGSSDSGERPGSVLDGKDSADVSRSLNRANSVGAQRMNSLDCDNLMQRRDEDVFESRQNFERIQQVDNSEDVEGTDKSVGEELAKRVEKTTIAENKILDKRKQNELSQQGHQDQDIKTTIDVQLQWVDYSANIASISVVTLALSMRCAKCSTLSYMILQPNRTVTGICQKCSNGQSVFMKAELIHENSNVLARLEPKGCRPVDCVLLSSSLKFTCLNCNRDGSAENLSYGIAHKTWCFACHGKCEFIISAIRFTGNFHEIAKEDASVPKIKVLKKKKPEQQLLIVDGEPLPEHGTCKHYKKSYRWLRFPCCGKLYACDVCHAENEPEHEMKFATRMVCGFCSKEQPFQMSKPCIRCSENVTRVKSAHWEGGKGCRDQKTMSRNDDRKYANSRTKTVSKKHAAHLVVKKKLVKDD